LARSRLNLEVSRGATEHAQLPIQEATQTQWLPWLIAVAFFMESLDTTILNTGVPAIAAALHVQPLSMKAVLSSYTLALAVFIPISGWMADRYGTRRVFAAAIGVFTLGSILCGLSSNVHLLVASRVLQGMGGAMMVPVGRLTLVRSFPKAELVRAMSFVAVPSLIAPTLGPLIGGLIVTYLNWRMIFFINIPIGLLGLVMVYLKLPDYRNNKRHPLDLIGLILFGSGIALLSYVLEVFGQHLLSLSQIMGLLAVSGTLIAGYWLNSQSVRHPLLMLPLYRIRTFAVATSGSFLTRLGIGGMPFLMPLLYQVCLGLDPVQSGLLIMPQALGAITTKSFLPRLIKMAGYRQLLTLNTVIVGLWIMGFALVGPKTPILVIAVLVYIFGALTSVQYAGMNTLTYADVPGSRASGASSIASTLQQMSISFGVAFAGLMAGIFLPQAGVENSTGMLQGLHASFLILGGYTIISSAIFYQLRTGDAGGRKPATE
jgi:EmrB/QacA subfamily drug resistance transporter